MVLVMIPLVGRIVTTIPWMKERLVEMMMGMGTMKTLRMVWMGMMKTLRILTPLMEKGLVRAKYKPQGISLITSPRPSPP